MPSEFPRIIILGNRVYERSKKQLLLRSTAPEMLDTVVIYVISAPPWEGCTEREGEGRIRLASEESAWLKGSDAWSSWIDSQGARLESILLPKIASNSAEG